MQSFEGNTIDIGDGYCYISVSDPDLPRFGKMIGNKERVINSKRFFLSPGLIEPIAFILICPTEVYTNLFKYILNPFELTVNQLVWNHIKDFAQKRIDVDIINCPYLIMFFKYGPNSVKYSMHV